MVCCCSPYCVVSTCLFYSDGSFFSCDFGFELAPKKCNQVLDNFLLLSIKNCTVAGRNYFDEDGSSKTFASSFRDSISKTNSQYSSSFSFPDSLISWINKYLEIGNRFLIPDSRYSFIYDYGTGKFYNMHESDHNVLREIDYENMEYVNA